MFPIVVKFENLMKWKMKIELYWNNQMKIIMSLLSFCLGRGMFGIRDVWDVRCLRCGMFGMWDVRDVGCSRYWMFRMWDMECGMFAGMWDVDLQSAKIFKFAGPSLWLLYPVVVQYIQLLLILDHLCFYFVLFCLI